MAIDYIEVRSAETREIIGIVDGAQSVIWHNVYYGTGDFEIYASANANNAELLQVGNYVTKPCADAQDAIWNNEPAIIERIEVTNTVTDGRMILASGRLAKSILDRRHIYQLDGHTNTPTILKNGVETAVRGVVYANIINCDFDASRNIDFIDLGTFKGYSETIVDEYGHAAQKQVSFQNLLTYISSVLEEYGMSCQILL